VCEQGEKGIHVGDGAILFAGFGVVALFLAASGIFAVIAYAIGGRLRECGIRMALGAKPQDVVSLVMREGLAFPVIGLAVGALTAVASARVLAASLYEVSSVDPDVGEAKGAAVMGSPAAAAGKLISRVEICVQTRSRALFCGL
jgi:ABC-type antimicrobial peptide transport system permease subunit